MKRRFGSLITVICMLASMLLVAAAVPGFILGDEICTHTRVQIWDGLNRTGDTTTLCGDIADLNNITHAPSGNCDNHPLGDNSWDDCISSFQIINNVHALCFGIFSNPRGITQWPMLEGGQLGAGYWSNMNGSTEDNKATSIDWWNGGGTCPGNG